jgi:hypothetical protein
MKKQINVLAAAILSLTLISTQAQPGMRGGMGAAPSGPNFGGGMAKIFGDNSGFSATMEMHSPGGANGGEIVMPGKLAFLDGKSRFEMDMTDMKGSQLTPQRAGQMKQMGMGNIIAISRPDKKVSWAVYPGLQAYTETQTQDSATATTPSDYKIDETKLGEETVDGHPCVKKKVVVTGKEGQAHESTVWTATDLKNFPVKIESNEGGKTVTMLFKDIKLEKPDAAQFEPPSDFKKYDNMMTMMQTEMMKRMGGGRGMPGQ